MMPTINMTWRDRGVVLLLALALPFTALSAPGARNGLNAAVDADGRTFTVTVPGVIAFQAGYSATVEIDGKRLVLSSDMASQLTHADRSNEATPYDSAEVTATTFSFENAQVDLLFRFGLVPGVTGVTAQAGIRNAGTQAVRLFSVAPVALAGQVAGNPSEWLVTALNESSFMEARQSSVLALGEVREPLRIHECGALYRTDGAGFFFGPVGTPIAYVDARLAHAKNGKVLLNLSADMSGVSVDPGEVRWGQQVVLLVEPPQTALTHWADWVAGTHVARTAMGAMSGWNDGNGLKKKDDGKDLLDVVNTVRASGGRLHPRVIQLQDQDRQALNAPWLPTCEQRIGEAGARFGIRLDFSRKADTTVTNAAETIRQAVKSGFTYLEINSPPIRRPSSDSKRTAFELFRDEWKDIRSAAGDDVYLLFSADYPDRAVVGIVDACRAGPDVGRREIRTAMRDLLVSCHLQGRWFAINSDEYYLGTQILNTGDIPGGWPVVRTWISMVGLSCGSAMTSDPFYLDSFKPYLRNIEVLTPPATEHTGIPDLCTDRQWPRMIGHVTRDWGKWTVALLWNPAATEAAVHLDFASAGLDPKRNYAVWSFWDNRYLGVANGSWTTPTLAPSDSQHLRFTDLDLEPDRPVVIGSSLHIYCGAAEIKHVTSLTGAVEIELTDAGARDGDLFVYSRQQPVLKNACGCTVKSITAAGENVWRISLTGRQRNETQRVELSIPLPFTKQPWFWLLIAAACTGLLFGVWRYMAGVRLQREYALDMERARLARDLHDDLGGDLSSIAMLSDLAMPHAGESETVRTKLREISNLSRESVRRLEEIVWAINPANDDIERFAGYFCKVAQSYLVLAGVRSRFDVPDQLPARPLTSMQRHNLFLAAKEALHNAVRHGKPQEVTVRISLRDDNLIVIIEDNGSGFIDTPELSASHGSGNMAARMKHIGGTFERRSAIGGGTTVIFSVPLRGA